MPKTKFCPLKLTPAFQDYLWGGTKLRDVYHKPTPPGWTVIAESWEVSTHPHGRCHVCGGQLDGQTLQACLQLWGPTALGTRFTSPTLPILAKIIDAAADLSIQVHPYDDYARKYENARGKTEMWYVLDAKPGAFIYYGFKKHLTADEFEQRIKDNTLLPVLKKVTLKKGDVFMIPAGTLHGIGKNLVIFEVQQNSDLTYRIYDYGRRDKDGNLRPLHLEKALDVTHLGPAKRQNKSPVISLDKESDIETLVSYKDFIVKRIRHDGRLQLLSLPDTYQVLFVTEGKFTLRWQEQTFPLNLGETIFLPAGLGDYFLTGKGELLLITDN